VSVLVVGDANVDLEIRLPTPSGGRIRANPEPRLFGGGSAANTAAALARLGVPCRFAGTVGDDGFGRFTVVSLADSGVGVGAVGTTPDEPTVAVITVTQPGGERLIYVWPPSGGAHAELDATTTTEAVAGAEWLHVSGICLRVSPAREALLAAMEQARVVGVPVSFDLNLRLENWGWDNDFRSVVEAAVERCDVVLGAASDEIGELTGIDDPAEAVRSLAGDGRTVVARLGADGAVACSGADVIPAAGFEVPVVDTVGAGDAFNAGFIAARRDGHDMAGALRWGNAVAALTIAQPGARSTPSRTEVKALLE